MEIAGHHVRLVEAARAGWGAALLIAPRQVMTHAHHVRVDSTGVAVARVLGARQLTQAVLSGLSPSPEVLAMGVWVDGAHALSAIGLAVVDRTRARAGLTDAAVATTWALAGLRDLEHGEVPPPAHDRRRDRLARWTLDHLPASHHLAETAAHRRSRVLHQPAAR